MKRIFAMALSMAFCVCHAACTDPAEPGVNWDNCDMDHGRDLTGKNLRGASIRHAKMILVKMESSDLRKVNFQGANLAYGRFAKVDARGANFTDAVLYNADFTDANLEDAILTRTELTTTTLKGANLTGVKWTDGSKGCGPGSIGVCR
jgi:uncharacterized protein YjbI with pentapeptide repeats